MMGPARLLAFATVLACLGCESGIEGNLSSGGGLGLDAGGGADEPADAGPSGCRRGRLGCDDDLHCPAGTFVVEGAEAHCEGCPTGSFSDQENAPACTPWTQCMPGEYVSQLGTAQRDQRCGPCAYGLVSVGTNAGACVAEGACPGGTRQTASTFGDEPAECEACEAGTYCAGGGSTPHPCGEQHWDHDGDPSTACAIKTSCAVGEHISEAGTATSDRECEDCPEGSFTLTTNAAMCEAWSGCAPGTFVETPGSSARDAICAACSPGTFSSEANQDECESWTTCAPGQFVATAGSAHHDQVCEPCPTGQTSTTQNAQTCVALGSCPAGTRQTAPADETDPAECAPCSPGGYCAGGSVPPLACAPGTWDHDADSATACITHSECLAGSYVAIAGTNRIDRECAACADGSFSTVSNAPACTPWQQCGVGTRLQTAGSATSDVGCTGCESGTFSDAPGASVCVPWTNCQPGQYVSAPGSATMDRSCQTCPTGSFSQSVNAGACVAADQCAPGTVVVTPGTETSPPVCEACTAGYYCAGADAGAVVCPNGTWDDDQDPATPCVAKTDCAAGQFVSSQGSMTTNRTCGVCASGTFSNTTNAPSCEAWVSCAAGSYVSSPGTSTANRVCTACASGSFSTTTNAAGCTAWTTCEAPSYYMSSSPSATKNRQCAACTPPEVTSGDNDPTCAAPAFQMSSGTVVMEAEHYHAKTSNGSWDSWYELNISWISGGKCLEIGPDDDTIWTSNPQNAAPRLDYNVNFTSTGTFYLFVRGDAGLKSISTSDSCHAGVDNTPIGSFYDFEDNGGTWGWKVQTVNVATTGVHTVSIWGREDGFRIDKIVVSTSSAMPSGNGPAESPQN